MTKKLFSVVLFFLLFSGNSEIFSQCTPSVQNGTGIFPVEGSVLHPAAATELWSLNVTVIVPFDTIIPPLPAVPIDSASIKSFIGFPPSFAWDYNTPSGYWPGNSAGCVLVYGTPATSDTGLYQISVIFEAVLSGFKYKDTLVDYWTLEIKDSTHVSISSNNKKGEKIKLSPVPAKDFLIIETQVPVLSVRFFTINGMEMRPDIIESSQYKQVFSLSNLKSGFYFSTIETKNGLINRKFLVTK